MKNKNLDPFLRIRVRRYLEYINDDQLKKYQKGKQIIKSLSSTLKYEIYNNVYGSVINNAMVLSKNFSSEFLDCLIPKFNENTYTPEDIIVDKEGQSLFFILSGKAEIFVEKNNIKGNFKMKTLQVHFYIFLIKKF